MTNTNYTFSGSGTAVDPYTYNFHVTAQAVPHMPIYSFLTGIFIGFCLGLLFFWLFQKRKSN
jgi:NhaP-type Na+/H+ or K+/H+ antiporter